MLIHEPKIIHNSDGTWAVDCRQCHNDSTTEVPIGIGLPLSDRSTAERLVENHIRTVPAHPGNAVAGTQTHGPAPKVVGYARVPADGQVTNDLGLEAQESLIEADCQRRGWELVRVYKDHSLKEDDSHTGRTALAEALAAVRSRRADALMVAHIDSLSSSLFDFAAFMEQSRMDGSGLVILDLGVDTTSPSGKMVANVMATFAQFERHLVREQTNDTLAAKRRQAARLGRTTALEKAVVRRISRAHNQGQSLRAIADKLNADGVTAGHGETRWHASTVKAMLERAG